MSQYTVGWFDFGYYFFWGNRPTFLESLFNFRLHGMFLFFLKKMKFRTSESEKLLKLRVFRSTLKFSPAKMVRQTIWWFYDIKMS